MKVAEKPSVIHSNGISKRLKPEKALAPPVPFPYGLACRWVRTDMGTVSLVGKPHTEASGSFMDPGPGERDRGKGWE